MKKEKTAIAKLGVAVLKTVTFHFSALRRERKAVR